MSFRFGDLLGNLSELKDLDLTNLRIVLDLNVNFVAEFFFGGKAQCLFKPLDENFSVDTFISTDLFDDTLYISYKH